MAAINNGGVFNVNSDTKISLTINNTGTYNVTSAASPTPATFEIGNTISSTGTGTINISQHGTVQFDAAASGNNVIFGDATGALTLLSLSTFANTMHINGLVAGDIIAIPALPAGFKESYSQATGTLTLTTSVGGALGSLVFGGASLPSASVVQNAVVQCFAAGTRIATPDGAAPVESLKPGDLVRLENGETGEIEWVGHRQIDCKRHPRPEQVRPFRIAANAFGPGTPSRDLLLSPDHAVFVDGVLIPIKFLDNGGTIRQLAVPAVTYHHIELREHALVHAEGLAVETLLPGSDRSAFCTDQTTIQLHPNLSARNWDALGCAPLIVTGPVLENIRRRLRRRKGTAGAKHVRRAG